MPFKNKETWKNWLIKYKNKNAKKIADYQKEYHKTHKIRYKYKNIEKRKAYLKAYSKEYAKLRNPNYKPHDLPRYKRSACERAKIQRERYPEKYKARYILRNAVMAGKLIRPTECSECNLHLRIEAHHTDYTKPLLVIWLCKSCHVLADKKMRQYIYEKNTPKKKIKV